MLYTFFTNFSCFPHSLEVPLPQRLSSTKPEHPLEVKGSGQEVELTAIAGYPSIFYLHITIMFLEYPKAPLHCTPYPGDKFIPLLLPFCQGVSSGGLLHDTTGDTPGVKTVHAFLPTIPFISVHYLFVPHHQFLKDLRVMHVGGGYLHLPYKLTALVYCGVGLVTVMGFILPDCPTGITVLGLLGWGWAMMGLYQGSIHYAPLFDYQSLLFQLPVNLLKDPLIQPALKESIPEPADGGLIGNGVLEAQAQKPLEAESVRDGLLCLRVGEVVPLLKKEYLQEHEGWEAGSTHVGVVESFQSGADIGTLQHIVYVPLFQLISLSILSRKWFSLIRLEASWSAKLHWASGLPNMSGFLLVYYPSLHPSLCLIITTDFQKCKLFTPRGW